MCYKTTALFTTQKISEKVDKGHEAVKKSEQILREVYNEKDPKKILSYVLELQQYMYTIKNFLNADFDHIKAFQVTSCAHFEFIATQAAIVKEIIAKGHKSYESL